jgi:hypothetical protein
MEQGNKNIEIRPGETDATITDRVLYCGDIDSNVGVLWDSTAIN